MPHVKFNLAGDPEPEVSIVVPDPCDTNIYYVFKQLDLGGEEGHVSYFKIDMRLNGGLGDAAGPETVLLDRLTSDQMLATPMASGKGYWLILHDVPDDRYPDAGWQYFVYRITSAGVSTSAVLSRSDVQYALDDEEGNSISSDGTLLFSPDGAGTTNDGFGGSNYTIHGGELLHFNRTTGSITRWFGFANIGSPIWSCFSPDSKKLYVSVYNFQSKPELDQFDLSSGDSATIVNSKTILATESPSFSLGPDGIIYAFPYPIATDNYIGIIQNPNAPGLASGFKHFGLLLDGQTGSPNLIETFLPEQYCGLAAGMNLGDSITCGSHVINFRDQSAGNPTAWQWSFPGATPSASTDRDPLGITYAHGGNYSVTLIVTAVGVEDTLTQNITILEPGVYAPLIPDGRLNAQPGKTIDVDSKIQLPAPIDWDTVVPTMITYALQIPRNIIAVDSAHLLAKINPPPGWQPSAAHAGHDSVIVTLANTLKQRLVNPLDLGSITFNVVGNSGGGLVQMSALAITTRDTVFNFCTSLEGDFVANIVIDSTASVRMPEVGTPSISISPNPLHGRTMVLTGSSQVLQHSTISFFDVLGTERTISTAAQPQGSAGISQIAITLPDLPRGHYYLRLMTGDQVITKGIVVQ
jgi:PKD repeat protein